MTITVLCSGTRTAAALLVAAALFPRTAPGQPKTIPAWEWELPQVAATVNRIRAGRDLTPKPWPGGARAAVALSFDIDTEESSLVSGDASVQMLSRREYAARVGVPRILGLLERYAVPVTFFIPALGAQIHPEVVDAILRSPLHHEIGIHGWTHEPILKLSADEERRLTRKAFDFWTQRLGHEPRGIRTPSWTLSAATLSIVRELGLLYDSSLMSDDRPYEILQQGAPTGIVEVPVELIADDYVYYSHSAAMPFFRMGDSQVLDVYRGEFDKAYEEGTLLQLTMHPLITGHRSRLDGLERLLAHIRSKPGIWFATHQQVAEAAKARMEAGK